MAISNQWNGRKVMQLTQAARFMTAALKMMTAALVQHEENVRVKQEERLREEVFKERPDIKAIENLMGRSCVRFADDGIHFDDHISVRLLKNYTPAEFSVAMAEHNVGCIRLVSNENGLTAVLYSSLDEDKMTAALKNMEMALGASPVVSGETLQKMCDARGNSKIFEFTNLTFADTKRFEFAAGKNSINIAIEKSNDASAKEASYRVKVLSSDKSKIEKALRDVAIYKTKDGADATDRHYTMLEKSAEEAAKKVVNNETFYICSPARRNSYIEVTSKGYNVINQNNGIPKIAKAVEGKISDSQKFTELCEEMSSFENPTILSKNEFSQDPDERLMTVVANLTTLEQKDEGKAYVSDLAMRVVSAANACDYQIRNVADLTSGALRAVISKTDIPDKESTIVAIEHLRNLPKEMVNEALTEYRDNAAALEKTIREAEREYEISIEEERDSQDIDIRNPEEKE